MRRETVVAEEIRGTPLAAALAAPEDLLGSSRARFVKDHRRTAVAAVAVEGREVFVKRFKPYVWYRRIEAALVISPARRCWQVSGDLERAGFAVAPPLAAVETWRGGLPADGYFVTATVEGAIPGARLWLEARDSLGIAGRRRFLAAAAAELRRFHDAGFYSRDANADNFLVRRAGDAFEFLLLDLENVRRPGTVSRRRRAKNLVQCLRPLRGRVRRIDQLRFVRAYLGSGKDELRRWLGELAERDRRKESEYRARRGKKEEESDRG